MKIYLHGPHAGKTIKINGVQFVDGSANVLRLTRLFERYHNCKDYAPIEELAEGMAKPEVEQGGVTTQAPMLEADAPETIVVNEDSTVDESDELVGDSKPEVSIEDEKELAAVVASLKVEVATEAYKTIEDFGNMTEWRSYVKEVTGIRPKNKNEGVEIMAKFIEGKAD